MKLTQLIGAAIATFGLSLAVQAAPAGLLHPDGAALTGPIQSGVTLIYGGGGGGGGGGGHSSGGGWGGHGGWSGNSGSGRSYGSSHISSGKNYGSSHTYIGGKRYGVTHIYSGERHHVLGGYAGGRHRRVYRGGGWYGYGWGDQSCFAECLTSGYSPAYCTANSWEFCY